MATQVSTSLYVYGITRAGADHGAGVRLVEHGELAAVVSRAPDEPVRARRRDLLRHMDVLQDVFATATVLPLQFGTVLPDEEAVANELLGDRYEQLVELLHRFDGLGELRVRATYREEEVLAELVRGDPRIARLSEATRAGGPNDPRRLQLGEAVARALTARRDRDARAIESELRPYARDVVVEELRTEYELLRAAFLVERRTVGDFDARMDDLARREHDRVSFGYTGPLPPHSFVSLQSGRR